MTPPELSTLQSAAIRKELLIRDIVSWSIAGLALCLVVSGFVYVFTH